MSERELHAVFPLIIAGTLMLGGALFVLAQLLLHQRRTGETFRLRRRAGERGGRLFILSLLVIFGGVMMGIGWLVVGVAFRDRLSRPVERGAGDVYGIIIPIETLEALTALALTPTDTPTAAAADTLTPTVTPRPTETATRTDTLTPTVTPSPTGTATRADTPAPTLPPFWLITNTPRPTRTERPRTLPPQ